MSDWKALIGAVAPMLATALGGPLAGVAVKELSGALLGRPNGTQDDVAAAIAASGPDVLVKLKAADQQFAVRMRELDLDLDKISQADRASARQAAVDGGTAKHVFWLTVVIFLVVIGVEALVLFKGVPVGLDGQMAGRILGTLDAALLAALYYTYGSSAGSAAKTDALARK